MRTHTERQRARRTPRLVLIAAGLVIAAALAGVVYAWWAETLTINGDVQDGHTNADFVRAWTNDPPGNPDPGYAKGVASCTATRVSDEEVVVRIDNAYPSYTCTFTTEIMNGGTVPERREPLEIIAPPVLTVLELTDLLGVVLSPGETDVEVFTVHVEKEAEPNTTYAFKIRKPFSMFASGTIGFWKNWDSHNTYTQAGIEGWLTEIDTASSWYGPTTAGGMETLLRGANGPTATPETRFLAQCLATSLDERSGRIGPTTTHDVTGLDAGNYLGLLTPASATLAEVLAAIELKYGTPPTNTQFNIMKNVCDAINNLDI